MQKNFVIKFQILMFALLFQICSKGWCLLFYFRSVHCYLDSLATRNQCCQLARSFPSWINKKDTDTIEIMPCNATSARDWFMWNPLRICFLNCVDRFACRIISCLTWFGVYKIGLNSDNNHHTRFICIFQNDVRKTRTWKLGDEDVAS